MCGDVKVVLICMSLMIRDVKHLFMYSCPFVCLLWKNTYSGFLPIIWLDYLGFAIDVHEFIVCFVYYPLIRYMVYKYCRPFHKLTFLFVDHILCCLETFLFDVVPLVYFCFGCLCFWCHIQKASPRPMSKRNTIQS